MKKEVFAELLQKPMTRKQFIVHLGMALLVISRTSSLLKTLSDPQLIEKEKSEGEFKHGFGKGSYGTN